MRNAIATSEGAIEIAVREYAGTLNGGRCLVAGFGRIGKALAWMLRGMGAHVTVSARKPEVLPGLSCMAMRRSAQTILAIAVAMMLFSTRFPQWYLTADCWLK